MFDIVDRRCQRPLVQGADAPSHLIGWQPCVLPGHSNDRDPDLRKNVSRHPQGSERAQDQ